jgi:hypothetical protein
MRELQFVTGMCRTYGALNSYRHRSQPFGLGYVLPRLRRSGFEVVDWNLIVVTRDLQVYPL